MFKFTDYINPLAFFIAFGIGIFFTYIFAKPKKIIIQWPNPENAGKLIYRDDKKDDTCYKYEATEITCPDDKSQIYSMPE